MPSLHTRYSGLESSLILNRVSAGKGGGGGGVESSASHSGPMDTTLLALELRRHERRRNLLRYRAEEDSAEANANRRFEKTKVTEVKDRLGQVLYRRGEKEQDRFVRELDQWLRKMRCSGTSGLRLEHFRDVKIGACSDPVLYGSPSLEPYPRLREETGFSFKGGKDRNGKFKGKGLIEFENGDVITGMFDEGLRHGECRVETFKNNLRIIIGNYERDKLNGKAKVVYNDDTWLEGYFKDGVLHGFCRHFDGKGRLTFVGNYKNGRPTGVCWKVIRGGGCVVGRVDDNGKLSGIRIAYLYPDYRTALVGTFNDGQLEFAQVAALKTVVEDRGVKVPIFTEPDGRLYSREVSTYDFITLNPLLPDPYESRMVEVKRSRVGGAGFGLFARVRIEPNTVLAFYNGKRLRPRTAEDQDQSDWTFNAYKIYDPAIKNGTVDIPLEFRDINNYTATVAHKVNHSFLPNAEFVSFDHPRFGLVPCVTSSHDIEAGEEVFVHYGYDLNNCPDWYESVWLEGSYPIPDSMRDGYAGDADKTNDDKADHKPEE